MGEEEAPEVASRSEVRSSVTKENLAALADMQKVASKPSQKAKKSKKKGGVPAWAKTQA